MKRCEGKTGGVCTHPATWKHSIYAGNREAGRFLYASYWGHEHAKHVAEHRKQNRIAPPRMSRLVRAEA